MPCLRLRKFWRVMVFSRIQIFAVATFNILIEAVCVSPFLVYLNNIVVPALAT